MLSKLSNQRIHLLFILATCFSCGGESSPMREVDIKVRSITLEDVANNGNASDIHISFPQAIDHDVVDVYKVMITQAGQSLTVSMGEMATQIVEIPATSSTSDITLPQELLTVDGGPVINGQAYTIYVLTESSVVSAELSAPAQISLTKNVLVTTLVESLDGGTGGMDIDHEGMIYSADFGVTLQGPGGNRVYKIDPNTGSASVFATGFIGASGNHFDAEGHLFQSNIRAGSISRISPDGTSTIIYTGSPLNAPVGIYINDVKDLIVANCGGNNLIKISDDGVASVYSSSPLLRCPNGITSDKEGNLYVANFGDGNIIKIDLALNASVHATLPGSNNGHLIHYNKNLYVVDRGGHQIVKVNLEGQSEVIAGNGLRGHKDGDAGKASFSLPNDLAISHNGTKIYVNEVVPTNGSNISPTRIRVIHLPD